MKRALIALTLVLAALPPAARAAQAPPGPTITVAGTATASRTPDDAFVSATLTTTNDSAGAAMSANTKAYDALHARLLPLGLADAAVKTAYFNVNFVPRPAATPSAPQYYAPRFGYTVTRTLNIETGNRDLVGKIIDACSAADASNVSVRFTLKNPRELYTQALAEAMRDARRQAQAMADAAGVRILGMQSAQSGSAPYSPRPLQLMARANTMPAPASPPTDISEPQDVDVQANVSVTYSVSR